ncbi:MAG: hypothetical protein AB8F34_10685, partial [Akkermansiaceae bacterium]
ATSPPTSTRYPLTFCRAQDKMIQNRAVSQSKESPTRQSPTPTTHKLEVVSSSNSPDGPTTNYLHPDLGKMQPASPMPLEPYYRTASLTASSTVSDTPNPRNPTQKPSQPSPYLA